MTPYEWRPYVPVANRRARARREMSKRQKRGEIIEPVEIEGRKIAHTFWGRAWCEHLEALHDYGNRLPRGRTYVRNGSLVHLGIAKGEVQALVMGSELYEVRLTVTTLPKKRWQVLKRRCEGGIGSLLELLEGRLSEQVMAVVADPDEGLFPRPKEITLQCSCPDWAAVCKHVAAAFYGVGARLDERPELLFCLRGVDHEELIATDTRAIVAVTGNTAAGRRRRIAEDSLGDVFGIEMAGGDAAATPGGDRSPGSATAVKRKKRRSAAASRKRAIRPPVAKSRGKDPEPPRSFTGAAVAKLRTRLEMSRSEFARLLGVTATSIGNWECTRGRLGLRARSLEALQATVGLTAQQARRRLRNR